MSSLEAAAAQLRARIQTIQDKYKTEVSEPFKLEKLFEVLNDENKPNAHQNLTRPINIRSSTEVEAPKVSDVVTRLQKKHEQALKMQAASFDVDMTNLEKKHLDRFDILIREKQELTEALTDVSKKLKTTQHELATTDSRHKQSLLTMKQKLEEQQRLSRVLWEKEKLIEIKEMTLRSLEPEVNKIFERKDQEIKDLNDSLTKRIGSLTGELAAANVRFFTELERTASEKAAVQAESIIERERNQVEARHGRELAELHHKLHSEFSAELVAAETRANKADAELYALKADAGRELDLERRRLLLETEVELVNAREVLRIETDELRTRLDSAKTDSIKAAELQLKEEFEMKLRALKSTLTAERDAKLKEVVEKFSLDAADAEHRIRKEARSVFDQDRSRWETERTLLEAEIARLTKLNEEVNADLSDSEATVAGLQSELRSARFGSEKFQEAVRKHRSQEAEVQRSFEEVLTRLRAELDVANLDLDQAVRVRDELRLEVENLTNSLRRRVAAEEEVIEVIEARLKTVLHAKDELIAELTGEIELWRQKCGELENLIHQQRQDILAHL
jgi:hypothetical protein